MAVSGLLSAQPATAGTIHGCGEKEVCGYVATDYRSLYARWDDSNYVQLGDWQDEAVSLFNNSDLTVRAYEHTFSRGKHVCIRPRTGIQDLGRYGLARKVSSIYADRSACGKG